MTIEVGQRVRVHIRNTAAWATGSVAKLQGKTGVVTESKRDGTYLLVTFDTPAETWHRNARPHAAFHFEPYELEVIP